MRLGFLYAAAIGILVLAFGRTDTTRCYELRFVIFSLLFCFPMFDCGYQILGEFQYLHSL